MLVGGIRSLSIMENLLKGGFADLVSMGRPFIREPDLILKLKSGEAKKAMCISCNLCFDPEGIRCNSSLIEILRTEIFPYRFFLTSGYLFD